MRLQLLTQLGVLLSWKLGSHVLFGSGHHELVNWRLGIEDNVEERLSEIHHSCPVSPSNQRNVFEN